MRKTTGVVLLIALLVMGTMSQVAFAAKEISIFISMPEYADAIRELINEYKKVKPDVVIHYETTQSDYPTLLKVKLNSGDLPDIFASTTGKEIELYKEYSLDLSDQLWQTPWKKLSEIPWQTLTAMVSMVWLSRATISEWSTTRPL